MKMTINPEITNKFNKLGDNTLKELSIHFIQTTPAMIKKMVEAYYLKDFKAVKKEAHQIHNSSEIVGAEILAEITHEIEFANDVPQLEEYLHERVVKAHKEFEKIKLELAKYTT
jgi:HPt (histidine-containing phosphotransfer) domain-containing protein